MIFKRLSTFLLLFNADFLIQMHRTVSSDLRGHRTRVCDVFFAFQASYTKRLSLIFLVNKINTAQHALKSPIVPSMPPTRRQSPSFTKKDNQENSFLMDILALDFSSSVMNINYVCCVSYISFSLFPHPLNTTLLQIYFA